MKKYKPSPIPRNTDMVAVFKESMRLLDEKRKRKADKDISADELYEIGVYNSEHNSSQPTII